MKSRFNILMLLGLLAGSACTGEQETDLQKPVIDLSFQGAFPQNCDTLYFGEEAIVRIRLTDDMELGASRALSISIHDNFNHHAHSTEVTTCPLDPVKEPVRPYTLITDFDLPAGQTEYETRLSLSLPAEDAAGPYEEGDYHFFIRISDQAGWSSQKGLSIKILHRSPL